MNNSVKIKVNEIINGQTAVSSIEGEKLYKKISENFQVDTNVELDFSGIKLIISAFLNSSIGQLYGVYETPFIKEHLTIKGMESDDLYLLKKVTGRAKEYFLNKTQFENSVNEIL
ncbi:MAG: STAS-like domain-containing protein [Bacteroidia bacterium]